VLDDRAELSELAVELALEVLLEAFGQCTGVTTIGVLTEGALLPQVPAELRATEPPPHGYAPAVRRMTSRDWLWPVAIAPTKQRMPVDPLGKVTKPHPAGIETTSMPG
jgi:hypothetical protein